MKDIINIESVVKMLEAIKEWPEPQPGAGEGLGPLAGHGMYIQYSIDRKRHREEIQKVISYLNPTK